MIMTKRDNNSIKGKLAEKRLNAELQLRVAEKVPPEAQVVLVAPPVQLTCVTKLLPVQAVSENPCTMLAAEVQVTRTEPIPVAPLALTQPETPLERLILEPLAEVELAQVVDPDHN